MRQPLFDGSETVRFNNIYGDVFAAFRGKRTRYSQREVIFPDGFTPKEGEDYCVVIHPTKTGMFTFNGERFAVSRAKLAEAASTIDEMDHIYKVRRPLNALADIFAGVETKS